MDATLYSFFDVAENRILGLGLLPGTAEADARSRHPEIPPGAPGYIMRIECTVLDADVPIGKNPFRALVEAIYGNRDTEIEGAGETTSELFEKIMRLESELEILRRKTSDQEEHTVLKSELVRLLRKNEELRNALEKTREALAEVHEHGYTMEMKK